jgi:hypothetical protein
MTQALYAHMNNKIKKRKKTKKTKLLLEISTNVSNFLNPDF